MPKPSWPSLSMPLMLSVPSSQTRTFGVWIVAPMLQPGDYYWRVTVHNESGFTQSSFDSVITNSGSHNGMRRFTVLDDGTVVNPL